MARGKFNATLTERRREQNRLAQRRFRERHRSNDPNGDSPSADQPSHRSERTRTHDDELVSPLPPERTVTVASLSTPQDSNMFSTDNTIHFGDVAGDFGILDIPSALGETSLASTEDLIPYLEHASFGLTQDLSPGHEPVETSSSSSCCSESESPLHMAVLKGYGKIVQLLLQHGADCNARDGQGLTPLIHAVIKEKEDIVDMLLSHGAQIQSVDSHQRSPLHWTVLKRQDRLLKVLIKHCKQNLEIINAYDIEGRTPLHIAINQGLDSAVEILLEAGADVKATSRQRQITRV